MTDMIEAYFMERISTHLWVLEDYQMDPTSTNGDISIVGCMDTLKIAKNYMKMLTKYQGMKK